VDFEFEFNPTELGFLPNAFGFAWTDGPVGIDIFRPGFELRIVVNDIGGNEFLSPYSTLFASPLRNGQSSEDVFFGVASKLPITRVVIFGVYYGESESMPYFEIDHVQYGRLIVPEPGSIVMMALLFVLLATSNAHRSHRRIKASTCHSFVSLLKGGQYAESRQFTP
jgi:hypothetical protein